MKVSGPWSNKSHILLRSKTNLGELSTARILPSSSKMQTPSSINKTKLAIAGRYAEQRESQSEGRFAETTHWADFLSLLSSFSPHVRRHMRWIQDLVELRTPDMIKESRNWYNIVGDAYLAMAGIDCHLNVNPNWTWSLGRSLNGIDFQNSQHFARPSTFIPLRTVSCLTATPLGQDTACETFRPSSYLRVGTRRTHRQ